MRTSPDPDEEFEMYSLPFLTEGRRAEPDRPAGSGPDPSGRTSIRAVGVEGRDAEAVHRLAALAGRRPPSGAVLLAEVAGAPVAAIGIFDGKVITDRARSDLGLRLRLHRDRLFVLAVIAVIGV
jgi:hypothetical protein